MPVIVTYFSRASDGPPAREALAAAGFEPADSPDGYSVVAVAQSKGCVGAMLGFELGDDAAVEIMKRLRESALGPAFPVVFVGACSFYEWEQALLAPRRCAFVETPPTPAAVGEALKSLLG